ncbi:hypothetical protein ACFW9N_09090 [Streptomyces sp. NPDC059496]|uniref:hypothetical protein n=1 Tax=Streptomyces sp. NPDC059496 TaxID=3346851 RepID=UPI00369CB9E0
MSVDSASCRAHQHAAGARKGLPRLQGGRRTPRQPTPPPPSPRSGSGSVLGSGSGSVLGSGSGSVLGSGSVPGSGSGFVPAPAPLMIRLATA